MSNPPHEFTRGIHNSDCWCQQPYVFKEKPPAKSSTSVLKAMCQMCGHRFDGFKYGAGEPCICFCHREV